jgi:phospholipid/cholesterol/gamma-HCH transport system substrate-binding protein
VETKAHHVTIGAFILASVALAFGFIIWLAEAEINRDTRLFDIYFEESVSGLSTASSVLYKGVAVGSIRTIQLDPEDPARVRVTIEVLDSTPIRENAVATLAFQGITGVSNIEIEGGSADALPLMAKPGQEHAVIPSKPSVLQEILGGAPDMVNEIGVFVADLQKIVSPENRQAFSEIMLNLNEITGGMAFRAENINRIIENMDVAMQKLVTVTETLNEAGARTNALLDSDVPKMVASITATSQSLETLTGTLQQVVDSQKGPVTDFTSQTLPEMGRLVEDARRLTTVLNRIANKLEDNPSGFIFSAPPPEYQPGD